MDPLLLVRRVPPTRLAVTRRTAAGWQAFRDGVEWWELVDPVCDDEHPASALAAVTPAGTTVRLVGLAAPPGRPDLAQQVLIGLVDALRAGSARTLLAAPSPSTVDVPGLLLQAGFHTRPDGERWALDL